MTLPETIKAIQRALGAEPDGVLGPVTAALIWRELNEVPDGAAPEITHGAGLAARTIATIETLDPKAQDRFVQFFNLANATAATYGCEYLAVSGTRSWVEQRELKQRSDAGGPHAAAPGYSWHNFGTAVDCGVFQGAGKIYLDDGSRSQQALAEKVHAAVALHAAKCGLEWGGSWTGKSCDPPHFQCDMGHSSPTAADRAKFKQKGSVL